MTPQDQPSLPQHARKSQTVQRGLWTVTILLAVILVVSIFIWKPWQPNIKAADRTIAVTGMATVTATPDQYVFSPSYDLSNANQQTALSELTSKSTEVVTKLKAIGVPSTDIKTNSSGYNDNSYFMPVQSSGGTFAYTLALTITINSASLAQKVQDYLITTNPTGDISPNVDFSAAKKVSVEATARNQAEKDARAKADQSASNLGFKVDQVKSVVDGSLDSNFPRPLNYGAVNSGTQQSATPQLNVQPGQNDLTYSVSVVYYIH